MSQAREPHFAQVALSVADMAASLRFYVEVLGFQSVGGRYAAGPGLAAVQGLTNPSCAMWWLVNEQPFFQFELFQYTSPKPAPRGAAWRPSDIGYSRLTFTVPELEATLGAARALGASQLAPPIETHGIRRASILDPTGIPVELVERPGNARLIAVGASVNDLASAGRYFGETLGMPQREAVIDPARERLWRVPDADGSTLVASSGDLALELTQYTSPTPAPRRPGYQLNDHGILNIALGYREWDEFSDAYTRVAAAGYRYETKPMGRGGAYDVSYTTSDDGFSVELLYCPESSDQMLGFSLGPQLQR